MIVWLDYACSVKGDTFKFVECEGCKQKYIYRMERQATGEGHSLYFIDTAGAQGRAINQARAQLQESLASDCDPVPCPKCGSYQQQMIQKLVREQCHWMFWAGILAIIVSLLCGIIGYVLFKTDMRSLGVGIQLAASIGIVVGVGMIIWRRRMAQGLEPYNEPLAVRLAVAADRAERVANFEDWLAEHGIQADSTTTQATDSGTMA